MTTDSIQVDGREYTVKQFVDIGGAQATHEWMIRIRNEEIIIATCRSVVHPNSMDELKESYESQVPIDLVPDEVMEKLEKTIREDERTVHKVTHDE